MTTKSDLILIFFINLLIINPHPYSLTKQFKIAETTWVVVADFIFQKPATAMFLLSPRMLPFLC